MWEDLLFKYFLFVRDAVRHASRSIRASRLVALAACLQGGSYRGRHSGLGPYQWRDTAAAVWAKNVLRVGLRVEELDRILDARLGRPAALPVSARLVADSDERVTLVEAGCGNGKTLAAYMWARRHAAGRRLVFCYPTTGTTSAGFQDYLLAQTDLERALMHSRASADIEQILDNGGADDDGGSLWIADILDLWGTKVVACTVDSVLSLLACWRPALAAAPVFAQSAFVFDEVHSYDRHLFGAFLAFLRWARAPCLVMTASLSEARRAAIERACGAALQPIRGEPAMEDAVRYRVARVDPRELPSHVEEARESGGKALYVANTVDRATEAFRAPGSQVGGSHPALPQPFQVRGPSAYPGRSLELSSACRAQRSSPRPKSARCPSTSAPPC